MKSIGVGRPSGIAHLSGVVVVLALLLILVLAAVGCTNGERATTSVRSPGQTGTTRASNGSGDFGDSPAAAVASRVGPSVVQITAQSAGEQGLGSGVIYRADGFIITNNHVVTGGDNQPASTLTVTLANRRTFPATLVGRDPRTDVALIRIQASDLPAASFAADLTKLEVGDWAIAIGNPLGLEGSVTLGIVSGINRELQTLGLYTDLIQTDASISPGNSGGALVDEEGTVIGINVAAVDPQTRAQNLGFAIPSDLVLDVVEQLRTQGTVRYGFLGIRSLTVTATLQQQLNLAADSGVLVVEVTPGSPAATAGLRERDIIVQAGGQDLQGQSDLFSFLRDHKPGDRISLTILRDGQRQTVQVALGEVPSS